jgi:hypothetical protein
MVYNCLKCNKNYKTYQTLWKHNKLYHKPIITDITGSTTENYSIENKKVRSYICEYCNKIFTRKNNMNHHKINSCTKNQKDTNIKELEIKLTNNIEKLEYKIEKLEKKTNKKVINNTNNGTIINNNNIIINKIGSENLLEFNDNEISQIFNKELESIITFIELLNFNERLSLFLGKYNFPKNKDWVVG